jgi:hypothetical protein
MNLEHQNFVIVVMNEIEKFLEKPSKKPKRKGESDLCHGILTMSIY